MITPALLSASGKGAATSKLHFSFRDVDLRLELLGLAKCGGLKSLLKNRWRCHSEESEATRKSTVFLDFSEKQIPRPPVRQKDGGGGLGMTIKGTFSTGR